ncbi:hypothetical protein K492DRAFT_204615 [Lichtheimia hyalospora FSU 10163]|nr:hypothetical protein K492DRAFT_204615 [Lichtheimia hyalospora FSU 10163]
MSGQPPAIRLYYKPEIPWEQIDDQIQSDQGQGAIILNIFPPEVVPVEERGYECLAAPYVFNVIPQNAHILAKVTTQGPVPDDIQYFIDNEVPNFIAQAQGY